MLLIALFYLALLLFLMMLINVLLTHGDTDKRTILPALCSRDYGVKIKDETLYVFGSNYENNYTGNTFVIGSETTSIIPVSFTPPERKRSSEFSGGFVFLMSSISTEGSNCTLNVFDKGGNTFIGDKSRFFIPYKEKYGLTKVTLSFTAKKLENNKIHDIIITGNVNPESNLLINTGYVFYN